MPGSTNDLELLTLSGGVERMHESEAAGMAKGYVGMAKRYTTHTFYVPKKKPPLGGAYERGGELQQHTLLDKSGNRTPIWPHELLRCGKPGVLFRHRRYRHSRVVRVVAYLADCKIERYLAT